MKQANVRWSGGGLTVLCAFVYFCVTGMIWMLIGSLGNALAAEFQLSNDQKALLVAVPIVGGMFLQIIGGLITDRIGPRLAALCGLAITTVPLLLGWLWVSDYDQLLVVGLLLSVAGASFATALPMVSRSFLPRHQGLVLGIVGAGYGGTAIATVFGPRLTTFADWRAVFALSLMPVASTLALVWVCTRDDFSRPSPRPVRGYLLPLKSGDGWWFCLFYSATFGVFAGLAGFLNEFLHHQYALTEVSAGLFTVLCVVAGSVLRPVGGYLADRRGGIRVLLTLYLGIAGTMFGMSLLPTLTWGVSLLFVGMCLMGMGNGAVFQLVPQLFAREIGIMTGLIGSIGGITGLILPSLLVGIMRQTGTFGGGFVFLGLVGLFCATALAIVSQAWEHRFVSHGGLAVGATDYAASPEEVLTAPGVAS